MQGIIRELKEELGIQFAEKEAVFLKEIRRDKLPPDFKDLWVFKRDIKDEEMFISNSPDTTLEATVKVYEMLGAEVYLYFDLAEYPITARVDSGTTARPGDKVKFAFDVEKIHIFDKETEQVITN